MMHAWPHGTVSAASVRYAHLQLIPQINCPSYVWQCAAFIRYAHLQLMALTCVSLRSTRRTWRPA